MTAVPEPHAQSPTPNAQHPSKATALFISVFIIATSGLIYELIAGALASYLLGDSVTQFSLVIGGYLSAMGLGSYLSKYVQEKTLRTFLAVEIAVGLLGGFEASILFFAFGTLPAFKPVLYLLVAAIGTLVGLEIPLLLHILKDRFEFKDLIANVLFLDYAGALFASILFPFIFVPVFGLLQTSFFFGAMNVSIALWASTLFAAELPRIWPLRLAGGAALSILVLGFFSSGYLHRSAERQLYDGTPIYTLKSRAQTIVLTHERGDLRLYLSGHLQFSSRDEHRYHEALVHPAFAVHPAIRKVLVLGGGDGLAVREVLKHPQVDSIHLVDLDPAMTDLFRREPILRALNEDALNHPKVRITNEDAMRWLEEQEDLFDLILVDLPDPSNYNIGKLYSKSFYHLARRHLSEMGVLVVQSTSPYHAPKSFACVLRTIEATGCTAHPYHAYVPSFGEWGFILALKRPRPIPGKLPQGLKLRFLDDEALEQLFSFPPDMRPGEAEVNLLNTQVLVAYYTSEWGS